jgi:hypothetical protein
MKTAVFIDGGHFLKRFRIVYQDEAYLDPVVVATQMHKHALRHVRVDEVHTKQVDHLYRIFFYDCPPLNKKVHLPISKNSFDYSKTKEAIFRNRLHEEIRKKRKVALRLGRLDRRRSVP